MSLPVLFGGYPSTPSGLKDTVETGLRRIGDQSLAAVTVWPDLEIGGNLIISQIVKAIDASDICAFEITYLNQNVLWELGYSIGRSKKIWLLRDATDAESRKKWDQLKLLSTIGHVGYSNSSDLVAGFRKEMPHQQDNQSLLGQLLSSSSREGSGVLYIQGMHRTDAIKAIEQRVNREKSRGIEVNIVDQEDLSIRPLSWYAQQILGAHVVVVNFDAPRKVHSEITNARNALVAGLAYGLGRKLLMVAEEGFIGPIDFRDHLFVYSSPKEAVSRVDTYLTEELGFYCLTRGSFCRGVVGRGLRV